MNGFKDPKGVDRIDLPFRFQLRYLKFLSFKTLLNCCYTLGLKPMPVSSCCSMTTTIICYWPNLEQAALV